MSSKNINTVVIKTDQKLTSAPHAGQRVRMEGRGDMFVVLRVDAANRVVDLVCTQGTHAVQEGISFDKLRVVGKGISDALDHFLKSA